MKTDCAWRVEEESWELEQTASTFHGVHPRTTSTEQLYSQNSFPTNQLQWLETVHFPLLAIVRTATEAGRLENDNCLWFDISNEKASGIRSQVWCCKKARSKEFYLES